jgi:hypothetical protein
MAYTTPEGNNDQLNEPHALYGEKKKMKLRIFHSFEEAAEAEALADAQQTPVERLRETVELILKVYGVTREQLKARNRKLHLHIIVGK